MASPVGLITGTVDQELLLRNKYLAAENRTLKVQVKSRLLLSDAEWVTLAEIGHRLGRKAFEEVAATANPISFQAGTKKTLPISLMDRRRVKLPVLLFISLEKDLASMGSFTPSATRIQRAKKKTAQFTRELEGKKIQLRATILPSAEYSHYSRPGQISSPPADYR